MEGETVVNRNWEQTTNYCGLAGSPWQPLMSWTQTLANGCGSLSSTGNTCAGTGRTRRWLTFSIQHWDCVGWLLVIFFLYLRPLEQDRIKRKFQRKKNIQWNKQTKKRVKYKFQYIHCENTQIHTHINKYLHWQDWDRDLELLNPSAWKSSYLQMTVMMTLAADLLWQKVCNLFQCLNRESRIHGRSLSEQFWWR